MAITSTDLKFFGAQYPVDETYGGGRMSGTVVLNGTENSIFPDIDATARASGRVQLRKVFAAVMSADADAMLGARLDLKLGPADAAVGVVAFTFGDQETTRAAAEVAIGKQAYFADIYGELGALAFGVPQTTPEAGNLATAYLSVSLPLGTLTASARWGGTDFSEVMRPQDFRVVTAVSGSGPYLTTFNPPFPSTATVSLKRVSVHPAAPKIYGRTITTAASAGSAVSVAAVEQRIVPNVTPYPAVVNGFVPSGLSGSLGKIPIFRIGDTVVLRNGATVETAIVSFVDYRGALTFTAPLVNTFPIGSSVSSMILLGDMQCSVGASFSQQTWTKVFQDALIGNTISANYNRVAGVITTTNLGAETERWAIVFTSATAFKLIGEDVGQIAAGVTTAAFAPLNPVTNTPYFTIPAAGWGADWAIGNVLRFNTTGARAPFWVARTISPSAPGGLDGSTFELRGSVNA